MQTSVVKYIFDKDILCNYGFSKVASNQFSFPISGAGSDLISGTIDGVLASLGSESPLSYIKANYIDCVNRINIGGDNYISADEGYFSLCLVQGVGSIAAFHDDFVTFRDLVNTYATTLPSLTDFAITQLINLKFPNSISETTWKYLHSIDQSVDTAASVEFTGASIVTIISTRISTGLIISEGDITSNAGNLSVHGNITSTNGALSVPGNITSTNGALSVHDNITSTNGDVYAHGNVTANFSITSNNGNIAATAGNITAGKNLTYGGELSTNGQTGTYTKTEVGPVKGYFLTLNRNANFYLLDNTLDFKNIYGIDPSCGFKSGDTIIFSMADITKTCTLISYVAPGSTYNVFKFGDVGTPPGARSLGAGIGYKIAMMFIFDGTFWRHIES